jgi:hypothetical protein
LHAGGEEKKVEEFFYRNIYLPKQGMFCQLPKDLFLGQRLQVVILAADSLVIPSRPA